MPAPEQGGCWKVRSSGSSGEPVHVWWNGNTLVELERSWKRVFKRLGYNGGSTLSIAWVKTPTVRRNAAGNRTRCIPAEADVRWWLVWLKECRPKNLFCMPTQLDRLLTVASESDLVSIELMVLWGEPFHNREVLREKWSGRWTTYYAAREVGPIGGMCTSGNYHLSDGMSLVEVVDEQGCPTKEGRILLTWEHGPIKLRRYELGDVVRVGPNPCPCGDSGDTLSEIQGRILPYLYQQNGELIWGQRLYAILGSLKSWQVSQRLNGELFIRYQGEWTHEIDEQLSQYFLGGMRIEKIEEDPIRTGINQKQLAFIV